ncbi:Oidioi.mRNA.OKI2018_I69.chr2.g6609.t1.cds [Oikopleura dioica]|uniref:Oidioi.mRNA.OKI2018_I69.chr2.g6609.t1.cds n=1 Tax=Oikopleura dioica TaxID=34765 RepID=A0ABN7T8C9_OIKDI|nr:Oidioi.mRNA.OKI2018_I69.chr2.g6609.t1.cds [Oikopleura dioica]
MGIDADIDEAARSKVDERLKDSIFCPVCKLILEDPVNLNCCGGHLCSKCRDGVLRTGYSNCPFCRKPNFTATKGRLMVDVLSTLKLICPNTDCRSSIPYEKYEEHKKNCLALHEKKCPECEQTTSLSKFHEHFKCFEKMAAKNAATKEENASLKTRLTEAEERLAGMTDGGVPFTAVVDEMNWDGDVETTRDGTSEPEGQKQLMKHKWIGGKNVRYNVTLL